MTTPYELLASFLKNYDLALENKFIAYFGDQIADVEYISKLRLNSPLLIFSSDKPFLNYSKLI